LLHGISVGWTCTLRTLPAWQKIFRTAATIGNRIRLSYLSAPQHGVRGSRGADDCGGTFLLLAIVGGATAAHFRCSHTGWPFLRKASGVLPEQYLAAGGAHRDFPVDAGRDVARRI